MGGLDGLTAHTKSCDTIESQEWQVAPSYTIRCFYHMKLSRFEGHPRLWHNISKSSTHNDCTCLYRRVTICQSILESFSEKGCQKDTH